MVLDGLKMIETNNFLSRQNKIFSRIILYEICQTKLKRNMYLLQKITWRKINITIFFNVLLEVNSLALIKSSFHEYPAAIPVNQNIHTYVYILFSI